MASTTRRATTPARQHAAAAAGPDTFRPSFMVESNGGGRLESVPGFNRTKAMALGLRGGRVPMHLRDPRLGVAGDLEFAKPQTTFGDDDRVYVQDTAAIPWRCVCQLVIEGLHGRPLLGTGWLAGPSTLFTAGHNLFSHAEGHQATKVWVLPGRNGDAVPYGYFTSTRFATHPQWQNNGDRTHDLGVVWLDQPIGNQIGWFGFAAQPDASLNNLLVNNSGYPVDKPLGTQWFNGGRIQKVNPQMLAYGLDTEPGQSGSPIFYFDAQMRRIVVAVHAYGDSSENLGVRVTNDVYAAMTGWIR